MQRLTPRACEVKCNLLKWPSVFQLAVYVHSRGGGEQDVGSGVNVVLFQLDGITD